MTTAEAVASHNLKIDLQKLLTKRRFLPSFFNERFICNVRSFVSGLRKNDSTASDISKS